MLNAIPFFGWIMSAAINASMAVPFWLIWTVCGIGARFFYFLPSAYLTPGFWNCVGLFIVVGIINGKLPSLISVAQNNAK